MRWRTRTDTIMKIAVIYNRESQKVINLFGVPSREKYGLKSIQRIVTALKKGGHQVVALEGDKDLISNLEHFMPQALQGERPGLALNLSYGIQGKARYTHVPGILEMVGIPYVGSGPLGHSLALDKVVAKMLFVQNGLPTPGFAVLDGPEFPAPELEYPLIVKPRNEAVSFGIEIVHDEEHLRRAAQVIFDQFGGEVLVERYIDGREVNVGILGNGLGADVLPPAELIFGDGGPKIYTEADKKHRSGREVTVQCPADLPEELLNKAKEVSQRAFNTLGLYDCARIDLRLDDKGDFYILEINSLPSLGEHGSYTQGAAAAGLDFTALVNRLIDVASTRYFGTPAPTRLAAGSSADMFTFVTQRRDRLERRIGELVAMSSRTSDPIGIRLVVERMDKHLRDAGMHPREGIGAEQHAWLWESPAGAMGGTLLVLNADVPMPAEAPVHAFRRDPELLYGEAIASSRAPMVVAELALRALRLKRNKHLRLGVLLYTDEGQACRYSTETIRRLSAQAARVLVLRPGTPGSQVVTGRRGQRTYRLRVEGPRRRLGTLSGKRPDALPWLFAKALKLTRLGSRKQRISVDLARVETQSAPMLAPHRVDAWVTVTYPELGAADRIDARMREALDAGPGTWSLELLDDRPPMLQSDSSEPLAEELEAVAKEWALPFGRSTSTWPSVAGLVPEHVPVMCGLGPVGRDLYTGQEAVERVSIVQRTLLLAALLARGKGKVKA